LLEMIFWFVGSKKELWYFPARQLRQRPDWSLQRLPNICRTYWGQVEYFFFCSCDFSFFFLSYSLSEQFFHPK
jgi:hypothetical protein